MTFFRTAWVMVVMVALGGASEALAQGKPKKPRITQQPSAQTVELGDSVVFTVGFDSTTSATCQWRRNKVPLPDATDTTYVIDTVLPEDAGKYDVVVTNAAGAKSSRAVKLTVMLAPESLPVDTLIYGSFLYRAKGAAEQVEGGYQVSGSETLQNPEDTSETYAYTYVRLPKDKARMTVSGSYYEPEVGGYITIQETINLKFIGVNEEGELIATSSSKGFLSPPAGYRPAKLGFTSKGVYVFQVADVVGGGSLGGTLVIGGGNHYTGSNSLIKSGAGTLILGGGASFNGGGVTMSVWSGSNSSGSSNVQDSNYISFPVESVGEGFVFEDGVLIMQP